MATIVTILVEKRLKLKSLQESWGYKILHTESNKLITDNQIAKQAAGRLLGRRWEKEFD